ncbi:phosphoglycerate mutase family protein-like protein [Plenodomus tracheiphilus IPT5]|uniref:Phosphoglycerate mutase family protein-like protein n=1 Tax=Plenodomus tracheiphilus IPT5 TaxID=1408161 RepID=A0A6A7AV59_9PLEO|nr:phosphoglycerate mutase family protein-like protein [Plenodomus tracheiphilus IPT5]
MAKSLKLFLIRHGETVDNVAQLLAGSRDSELTNHGYQQATRLGLHFRSVGLEFTHLFSSHLQRAVKTAVKIREGQLASTDDEIKARGVPEVVQLPLLTEQDLGSLEGKKWTSQPADASGKVADDFVAVETKEAMGERADAFLDEYLMPLVGSSSASTNLIIAIVSHGIFLSTLWKRILRRLPPKSVTLSLDTSTEPRPSLEHLGGWSNTGYLELDLTRTVAEVAQLCEPTLVRPTPSPPVSTVESAISNAANDETLTVTDLPQAVASDAVAVDNLPTVGPISSIASTTNSGMMHGWTTRILTINGKDHLKSLKRTGGGVGSSRHDASQKSIETFFKRRKIE